MTKFLVKFFVKNSNDTENPTVRTSYGMLASIVGIVSNLILFTLKIIIGVVSKSIAITADAINNLSDSASSVMTLLGFKISQKPADDKHPYGHARMEYLSGLIVSLIIFFIGLQFLKESITAIFNPTKNVFDFTTIIVLVISIFVKLWQGMFNRKIGKKINSVALMATSFDSISDVVTTFVVLLGIIASIFFNVTLDGYFGTAVAIFIIVSGIKLMTEAMNPLLGAAPDKDLVEKIVKKIKTYDGVLGLHDLVIHNYGEGRCFASVHVEVPAKQDIMLSHDIIDNIEFDFDQNDDIHIVIHLDPIENDNEATNSLKSVVNEIIKGISSELSMHDFRIVPGPSHTNLLFDISTPVKFAISDAEIRHLVNKKIKELDQSYNTVITVDRSYTSTTVKE